MTGKRCRSVIGLQARRSLIVRQVMDITLWDEQRSRALLQRAQWKVDKAVHRFARSEYDFTVAQADMEGSYADRRQQAIMFLMDALKCGRAEATKLLLSAGGSVEKAITRIIAKHTALKKRRLKYGAVDEVAGGNECDACGMDGDKELAGDGPIDLEPVNAELSGACGAGSSEDTCVQREQGESSDCAVTGGAGSSRDYGPDADEVDVLQAMRAVDQNEIQCLCMVFELDLATAAGYHSNAVPARNGSCFADAVNTIIAENMAEIIGYVERRNSRKLHKAKQLVMKYAANWECCRAQFFPFAPGRDRDPTGEAIASCFELVDNRELLPCDKKGCCTMKPSGGKAKVVYSNSKPSEGGGGKAKVVYNGKTKA